MTETLESLDLFDVVLLGFGPETDTCRAAGSLARVFGLDATTAQRIVATTPVTVRRNAKTTSAEAYRCALAGIGAQVELRRTTPPPPAPEGPVELTARGDEPEVIHDRQSFYQPQYEPPVDLAERERARRARVLERARRAGEAYLPVVCRSQQPERAPDTRTFWSAVPSSLIVPLRGPGARWLLSIGSHGLVLGAVCFVSQFMAIFGFFVNFFFGSIMLGLLARYLRACLWGVMGNEEQPQPIRASTPDNLLDEYLGPGLALSLFFFVIQVVGVMWAIHALRSGREPASMLVDPTGWLLFVGPVVYWPLGVALMGLTSRTGAFFDLPLAVRLILAAPLELLTTLVVGLAMLALVGVAGAALVAFFGPVGLLLAPALLCVPNAYIHGVQGALFGHLLRTRGDALS